VLAVSAPYPDRGASVLVRVYVSSILKKLGVKSRTDIAREAVLRTIAPR
jgi:hypothetical protein